MKNVLDFFSQTRHQFVKYLRFYERWSLDIARDLPTQYVYFKMLMTISSLCLPNFNSFAEDLANINYFPQVSPSRLFTVPYCFRKIIAIERCALRAAILHECQNYLL